MDFKQVIEFDFLVIGDFRLSLFNILAALVVLFVAFLVTRLVGRVMKRYFSLRNVDAGRRYAFTQFLKYIIYTLTFLLVLEVLGISISVFWGAAAALMVGIGLGLQQTFNDLVSGLILLIEGSVEVNDIIEVDGIVGTVASIGIRTSRVETRNKISLLVPNSKLVGDKAINWSHNNEPCRFQIFVGVAYSSNTKLVSSLLIQAASEHPLVLKSPQPEVQFIDFGNSSLDFVLHFFVSDFLQIDFVKSEIRHEIIESFRENNIEIPFPQNDLWLRNAKELEPSSGLDQ